MSDPIKITFELISNDAEINCIHVIMEALKSFTLPEISYEATLSSSDLEGSRRVLNYVRHRIDSLES